MIKYTIAFILLISLTCTNSSCSKKSGIASLSNDEHRNEEALNKNATSKTITTMSCGPQIKKFDFTEYQYSWEDENFMKCVCDSAFVGSEKHIDFLITMIVHKPIENWFDYTLFYNKLRGERLFLTFLNKINMNRSNIFECPTSDPKSLLNYSYATQLVGMLINMTKSIDEEEDIVKYMYRIPANRKIFQSRESYLCFGKSDSIKFEIFFDAYKNNKIVLKDFNEL